MWLENIKYILIAYFLGNIYAKTGRNRTVYVKMIASCTGGTFCETQCSIVWCSNLPHVLLRTYWVISGRDSCLLVVQGPISQHCWPVGSPGFQSTPSQLLLFQHASWQAVRLVAGCTSLPKECVFGNSVQQSTDNITRWIRVETTYHVAHTFLNTMRTNTLYNSAVGLCVVIWISGAKARSVN